MKMTLEVMQTKIISAHDNEMDRSSEEERMRPVVTLLRYHKKYTVESINNFGPIYKDQTQKSVKNQQCCISALSTTAVHQPNAN